MKTFKKIAINTALAFTLVGVALSTQAASISSMTITGGSFWVGGVNPAPIPFGIIGTNTNLVGGYIGGAGWNSVQNPDPSALAGFPWIGGNPANIFTAPSVNGVSGGPVPSGDITNSVINMDLSSWFWNWNGSDQNQGSANATGTASCIGTSCSYNLAWDSLMIGGVTNGYTAHWALTGTAQVVPIPAAVWLLGSGLLGLLGIARRKSA